MNSGWFKTHRKIIDSVVFQSDKCLKIWIWCLAKTNHCENLSLIGRQKVRVRRGQFIMGSLTAEEKLRLAKSTIWYWLNFLENEGMIGIKKTNKYSIITIKNWDKYQDVGNKSESNEESNKNQIRTNKNDKNEKKYIYSDDEIKILGEGIDQENFAKALVALEIEKLKTSQVQTIKKLIEKYPSRDYELQAFKCREWWFGYPRKGWKKPILAFANWLGNSKIDEEVLAKKRDLELRKNTQIYTNQAVVDPERKKSVQKSIDALREKMRIKK